MPYVNIVAVSRLGIILRDFRQNNEYNFLTDKCKNHSQGARESAKIFTSAGFSHRRRSASVSLRKSAQRGCCTYGFEAFSLIILPKIRQPAEISPRPGREKAYSQRQRSWYQYVGFIKSFIISPAIINPTVPGAGAKLPGICFPLSPKIFVFIGISSE